MDDTRRILLGFAVGLGVWLFCELLVWRWRARRLRDLAAAPPRQSELELAYGESAHRRSRSRPVGGIFILAAAVAIAGHPGTESWGYYVWGGLALLFLPAARNDLHDFARKLTVRPVISARREGLHLSSWRRTVFLPWQEVGLVYTEPPDSGGYIAPEQKVVLHIESKAGRRWRYSSHDFAEGSPTDFARLVELAAARTAPPGSMLARGGL